MPPEELSSSYGVCERGGSLWGSQDGGSSSSPRIVRTAISHDNQDTETQFHSLLYILLKNMCITHTCSPIRSHSLSTEMNQQQSKPSKLAQI